MERQWIRSVLPSKIRQKQILSRSEFRSKGIVKSPFLPGFGDPGGAKSSLPILIALLLLALSLSLAGCEIPVKLCGDQKCDTARGETYEWCSRDCRCGNGDCDANENPETCPNDCLCGDGRCQQAYGETSETCPGDCPATCGDGVCDKEGGETPWSCEVDCGDACGDGVCQPEYGEFGSTCAVDCAR
jgi:hypothetical protein